MDEDYSWLKPFIGKKVYLINHHHGVNLYYNGGRYFKNITLSHTSYMIRNNIHYEYLNCDRYDMSEIPLNTIIDIDVDLDYCHKTIPCHHSGKVYFPGYSLKVFRIPRDIIISNYLNHGKKIPVHFDMV